MSWSEVIMEKHALSVLVMVGTPPCPLGAVELSRHHPMASWLCAMLHCFGSYILADLLLGEPVIDYFSNNSSILLASAVW